MSTDALTVQWRWTELTDAFAPNLQGWVDIFASDGGGRIGGCYSILTMSDYNITSWTISVHNGGTRLGGATDSYVVPYTGACNSAPDIKVTMTIYRGTQPAGVGKFRVTALVETLTRGTSTVTDADTLIADATGITMIDRRNITGQIAVPGKVLTGYAAQNMILDGMTAPWPMEAVTTGTLIALGDTVTSGNIVTAGAETDIGINPPADTNLAVQPITGIQVIARRGTDADLTSDVYGRLQHGQAWSTMSASWPSTLYMRANAVIDNKHRLRMLAKGRTAGYDSVSYDHGAAWSATPSADRFNPLGGYAYTSIYLDPYDGSGMAAMMLLDGIGDKIIALREPQGDNKTVISNCRSSGETDCLPWPIVYRLPDGRWSVLWFVNDAPREYTSADGGATWSDASPTEDWTAGAGKGCYTSFWQSMSDRQVVAGWNYDSDSVVVLSRTNYGRDWTGPYEVAAPVAAVAPYIYQQPDGVWECGWLLNGSWSRYSADHPGGTWSAV